MPRVALLHFTTSPHVGGIESLIDCQSTALCSLGCAVRWVTGSGQADTPVETVKIPLLLPSHPDVKAATQQFGKSLPSADHALTRSLYEHLRAALEGCDACWVHNALSLHINPFLTVALRRLIQERPLFSWVIWCHDFSDTSPLAHPPDWPASITYVTLSEARRLQLSRLLSVPTDRIRVIPPALNPQWLDLTDEARRIAERSRLDLADLLILVPAKLLPHKNLNLVVRIASSLKQMVARPVVLITGGYSAHHPHISHGIEREIELLAKESHLQGIVHLVSTATKSLLDSRTLRDLFRLCDLVVLPSADEGFGVPLWEAAALRVPVLCSDIPAFREVGADWVHYFALNDHPWVIAQQAIAIADSAENKARRRATYSFGTFRDQIETLVNGS